MSELTVEAWWGPREETLGACAARAADLLRRLQSVHPAYSRWYEQGRSRQEAIEHPIDMVTAERLLPLLARNRGQAIDAVDPFGFGLGVWNGSSTDEDTVGVSTSVGAGGTGHMWNNVEVDLPNENTLGPVSIPECIKPVFSAIIGAYQPEIGAVTNLHLYTPNHDLRLKQKGYPGWMTWLRSPVLPVDGLGDDATVEPFEGGALITLGQRPMRHDNPEDIARIRDAWHKLREAGYPL